MTNDYLNHPDDFDGSTAPRAIKAIPTPTLLEQLNIPADEFPNQHAIRYCAAISAHLNGEIFIEEMWRLARRK